MSFNRTASGQVSRLCHRPRDAAVCSRPRSRREHAVADHRRSQAQGCAGAAAVSGAACSQDRRRRVNLREGFRRVYVVFAVCFCAAVAVMLLNDQPTAWKLAEHHRDEIARADVGTSVSANPAFYPASYVIEHYGIDLPHALARICGLQQSVELAVACGRYKREEEFLFWDQLRELAKTLGILSLVAAALFWIWRCLDWVF